MNKQDNSLKSFIYLSSVIMIALFLILSFAFITQMNITRYVIYYLELALSILAATAFIFLIIAIPSMIYVYKTNNCHSVFIKLATAGAYILMPFILFLSGLLKWNKDAIRAFSINLNNVIIRASHKKYNPEKTLLLLPHCLQNSNCNVKITSHIEECLGCRQCLIGEIRGIAEEKRLNGIVVATGGSIARRIIKNLKPEFIIAVACERDLSNGIMDVKGIPTIGILNQRPNGPCINTDIDIEELKQTLNDFMQPEPIQAENRKINRTGIKDLRIENRYSEKH